MTITITIKLFAIYQDILGVSELVWELPEDTLVGEVRDRLIQQYPRLEKWRDLTRFGLNLTFVTPEAILHHGDELVLIPPVSGG